MNDFVLIMPPIIVLLGAIVLLFMSMYPRFKSTDYITVSVIFLALASLFLFYVFGDSFSKKPFNNVLHNTLIFDSYSNLFSTLMVLGTIFILFVGESYVNGRAYFKGEFYSVLLFSLFGMTIMTMANELITAYIGLEIASFSVYIMIGFNSEDGRRVEAMFKYLVMGSFIGAFFLLGTALVYGAAGTTNLSELATYIQGPDVNVALIYTGMTMILFTFLFKVAAFPFQSWVLDVYRGSPIFITAYMASVFKVAIFAFFLRIYLQDFFILENFWHPILEVLVALTLMVGTWIAIVQHVVKRMLAASSIVHTGYLLLGFLSIRDNADSAYVVVFYLIAYLLTAIGAFGLVSHIIATTKVRVTYNDFKGLAQERPYLAAIMTIFLLSLAGIPGTIGFMAKFYIFVDAIQAGYIGLTILAMFATMASIYYYFKLIAMMYFYPSPNANNDEANLDDKRLSTYAIGFLGVLIIWAGIGSALFFLPLPNAENLLRVAEIALQSLSIVSLP